MSADRFSTAAEAIAQARRDLAYQPPGGHVQFFGDLEPEDRDSRMRECDDPDMGENVVLHVDTLTITGGEFCPACGESSVDEGES